MVTTNLKEDDIKEIQEEIDKVALNIVKIRKNPLLVLYYHLPDGSIKQEDIEDIYSELRRTLKNKQKVIDVLLHTHGGNVNPSYRIIRLIRDFADHINVLIPYHAYSGGTLLSLGADEIHFGAHAVISPIDIQAQSRTGGRLSLIGIDYYVEFVMHCLKKFLETTKDTNMKVDSDIETELLKEMVGQMGWHAVAVFFREREVTAHYARVLLMNYMFKSKPDGGLIVENIINKLLFKSPSHEFEVDYKIANEIGLPIEKMTTKFSDLCRELVDKLKDATRKDIICKYMGKGYRLPFFRLYGA